MRKCNRDVLLIKFLLNLYCSMGATIPSQSKAEDSCEVNQHIVYLIILSDLYLIGDDIVIFVP